MKQLRNRFSLISKAYEVGFGKSSEPALPILHKEARKILNLNLDFIYEVRDQIKEKAEEAFCTLF